VGSRYSDVPNENARKLAAYTTASLHLSRDLRENIKLYVSCDDIFDKQPVELVWSNRNTGELDDVVTAGRYFLAGVEMRF
jgi:outer membrane receptor protein involved in Fe transport